MMMPIKKNIINIFQELNINLIPSSDHRYKLIEYFPMLLIGILHFQSQLSFAHYKRHGARTKSIFNRNSTLTKKKNNLHKLMCAV